MIKDEDFIRHENVPLTKEEIRAISIGKLQLNGEDIVLDIGCGSGGMTVEMAKRCKFVYSVDISEDAINTTLKNLKKFNITNCKVIKGRAEDIIPKLNFNKVFIGGTKNIEEILNRLIEKNTGKIVANTIVLQNAVKILNYFEDRENYSVNIVNVVVSYGKKAGPGYMMLSKNPINIITIDKII